MADDLAERAARAIAPHLWAENVYVSRDYDETGTMAELIEKRRDHIRAQARAALAAVADDVDGSVRLYAQIEAACESSTNPSEVADKVQDIFAAYLRGAE